MKFCLPSFISVPFLSCFGFSCYYSDSLLFYSLSWLRVCSILGGQNVIVRSSCAARKVFDKFPLRAKFILSTFVWASEIHKYGNIYYRQSAYAVQMTTYCKGSIHDCYLSVSCPVIILEIILVVCLWTLLLVMLCKLEYGWRRSYSLPPAGARA